jgi:hypothetical protein
MRLRACLLIALGLSAACGSPDEISTEGLEAPVVYGIDHRTEVFAYPDAEMQRIARESIVALIRTNRIIEEADGTYSFFGFTLKEERGLCDDEPFGNQPIAATCSGTLIDDDLVLTAGHCIDVTSPCESYNYVFDYHLRGPDELETIRGEDVYSCSRLFLDRDPAGGDQTPDFAVIQLDRPVEGARSAVSFRTDSSPAQFEPLTMIGFGSGLPAKIDDGASVADARESRGDNFYVANLDAFGGHSGSATFDSGGLLAGILLGGRVPDYVTAPSEGCARANVFDDSEAGEIVHKIEPIVVALCQAGWENEALCADVPPCEGPSCGGTLPSGGSGGTGVVPGDSSGCSAARGAESSVSLFGALLLFTAARRFRRSNA